MGKDNNTNISSVLVDTSALRKADFDFIGVKSSRLLSFFSAVEEKDIQILSHPILDNEVKKHISNSSICKNYNQLIGALKKNKTIIELIGSLQDETIIKIVNHDINGQLITAYQEYYKYAVMLDYPNPEQVFNHYFSCDPPFSETGKKKYEFPDAFVIEAAKSYLEAHPNDVLLVISDDSDWKAAFSNHEDVVLCNSINEATNYINSIDSIIDSDVIDCIFEGLYDEILLEAQACADCEDYDYPDFKFINGLELDSIEVENVWSIFDILAVTRDHIILATTMSIKVSGEGETIDEGRSFWSTEEMDYIVVSYGDVTITDGFVNAACEIEIEYDFDDPDNSAYITDFKIVDDTPLQIKCDNVAFTPIDADELAIRRLREDKGV